MAASVEIHGVHQGSGRPSGWAFTGPGAITLAPGATRLFAVARVTAGAPVELRAAGSSAPWAQVAPGTEFTVTAAAPQEIRPTPGASGFTLSWGPPAILEQLDAYTGRRGQRPPS